MGIPIEKDWMDVILKLSEKDKKELIEVISQSIEPSVSPRLRRITGVKPQVSTEAERLDVLNRLEGAWKDTTPDDLLEQVLSARTPNREVNLDD